MLTRLILYRESEPINLQEQDDVLSRVFFYVQRRRRPSRRERAGESRAVMKLLRQWSKLSIKNGMLYKVKKGRQMNMTIHQIVVPDSLKRQVLRGLHDSSGHQEQPRTVSLARQRFFWMGMERDIVNHVRNCFRCVVGKTPEPNVRAPLESIITSEPMVLVCIDFWTAEQTEECGCFSCHRSFFQTVARIPLQKSVREASCPSRLE